VVILVGNDEMKDMKDIKDEIERLREDINRYIEYPDIFDSEIKATSRKIDILINDYIRCSSKK